MRAPLRSILAATDLEDGSDAVVHTAATLAGQAGAALHLVHALELPYDPVQAYALYGSRPRYERDRGKVQRAEEQLHSQRLRAVPEGVAPASLRVLSSTADGAILDQAREVAADLIVLGPHRGGAASAHFLGTTAERVLRTAEVPCLVVREPLGVPVRAVGVPLDCSDPSQGALEVALAWSLQLGEEDGDYPRIRVMHVGWPVERADYPDVEAAHVRPALARQVERAVAHTPGAEALDVGVEVRWANKASDEVARWVRDEGIGLLVMGTHGQARLRRALIGSMASALARRTPCPVLLVPPSQWGGVPRAPRLDRVVVATDFSAAAEGAVRWSVQHLAPKAEHVLVHVVEVPEPPSVLAAQFAPTAEQLQTLHEEARQRLDALRDAVATGDGAAGGVRAAVRQGRPDEAVAALAAEADLVVVGAHGAHRGAWARLGSTAERVLRSSPAPVLVARGDLTEPPRSVLVAVDGSAASRQALTWADFLRAEYGASLDVLHVEDVSLFEAPDATPAGRYGLLSGALAADGGREAWARAAKKWLRGQVRQAGVDPGAATLRVAMGRPATEILAAREALGADLVVVGNRGRGALGRAFLGSVSGAVLHEAPCPVLVVGTPAWASE